MNRKELIQLSQDFLSTYGYNSKNVEKVDNSILFSRPTGLGISDEILVYFHQKGEEKNEETIINIERNLKLLGVKFKNLSNDRKFFLSNDKLVGTPLSIIKNCGFTYQAPVQFFDREFSHDKRSPLKISNDKAKMFENERIDQPYIEISGEKNDLLSDLTNDLLNAKQPCLTIIIAPAGYGKTVLMNSLYTRLLENFSENKAKQERALRPLMMLPDHIRKADTLDELIKNFINDEYEHGFVEDATLKFWLNNGFALWLLDGLEELIVNIGDSTEFIEQLLNYIYIENKKPQIVISIRKPFLINSPGLQDIIHEWKNTGLIRTYQLSEWKDKQIEEYFEKNLIIPKESKKIFISDVKGNKKITSLCGVPYYCSVLKDLKNENSNTTEISDEISLIKFAVNKICDREFSPEKGLDKDIWPIEKQIDFFATIAEERYKKDAALTIDDYNEWAEITLPSDLAPEIKKQQLACIKRHAVLSPYGKNIDFSQEIVGEYFLAHNLSQMLQKKSIAYFNNIEIETDSFTQKYLLGESNQNKFEWPQILNMLWNVPSIDVASCNVCKNLFKIYLPSNLANKELGIRDLLGEKNLSGLEFENLNLSEFKFHHSNLTGVKFLNCNLIKAHFDGCHFKDTFISDNCQLNGATTNGAILESLSTEKKEIFERKEIEEFLFSRTNIRIENTLKGPCEAAIAFRKLIQKLTKKQRGYEYRRKFIGYSTIIDNLIETAINNDYFQPSTKEGDTFIKIRLNYYDELNEYGESFKPTERILNLLDIVCKEKKKIGCKHLSN